MERQKPRLSAVNVFTTEKSVANPGAIGGGELETEYREWCMVELMGHVRHYGLVTEVERFGQKMMRLEIHKPSEVIKLLIGGAAIYRVTETTEELCRAQYEDTSVTAIGYDRDEVDEYDDERDAIENEDDDGGDDSFEFDDVPNI